MSATEFGHFKIKRKGSVTVNKCILVIFFFCSSLLAESEERITEKQKIEKSQLASEYLDKKLEGLRSKIKKENTFSKRFQLFLGLKEDLIQYYSKNSRYFTDTVRNKIGLYNTIYLASLEGIEKADQFCYQVEADMRSAFKVETKESLPKSALEFLNIISTACSGR